MKMLETELMLYFKLVIKYIPVELKKSTKLSKITYEINKYTRFNWCSIIEQSKK